MQRVTKKQRRRTRGWRSTEEEYRRCDRAPPSDVFATKGNYGLNSTFTGPVICIISDTLGAIVSIAILMTSTLATNRQNEPIIAAFVIFPGWTGPVRPVKTRIVIAFPICIDWIPSSYFTACYSASSPRSFCRDRSRGSSSSLRFFRSFFDRILRYGGLAPDIRDSSAGSKVIRNGTERRALSRNRRRSQRVFVLDQPVYASYVELFVAFDRQIENRTDIRSDFVNFELVAYLNF